LTFLKLSPVGHLQGDIHAAQTYELPEAGEELRQKHIGAIKVGINIM
jgi:hypothetical protein